MPAVDPLRIALVASSYPPHPGGVEEHVRNVAHELRCRGSEVTVWTVDRGEHLGVRNVDGVEVRYLPTPLPHGSLRGIGEFLRAFPRAWRAWRVAQRSFSPDVLHVQCFGPNGIYALALRSRTHLPLIVSSHGETFMDSEVFSGSLLLRAALRRSLARAAAVTGCAPGVLEDLATHYGLRGGIVVPNGVDLDEGDRLASPTGDTSDDADQAPSGPADERPPTIFAVGRIVRVKGFDLLLRAFAEAELPAGTRLVIGGDGPELSVLRALAVELGVQHRVEFLGRLDRAAVIRGMADADVVVVPSRVEAFGIVVLEAWRAGTALIASDRGGPSDLVTSGIDGLLVDPDDTAEFAAALSRVMNDPALRQRLGAAGRRTVSTYTWARVAAHYERLYRAVRDRQTDNRAGRAWADSATGSPAKPEVRPDHTISASPPIPTQTRKTGMAPDIPAQAPTEMTASVVIATYNRADLVRRCLEHLGAQTRRPDQIIVVDASADRATRDVVSAFDQVEYLRNERGPGSTATSRAIGIARCTGDIVAFVDDDAMADPDWLEQLLRRYADPTIAAVGGRARNGQPGEESVGLGSTGLLLPNGRLSGYFAADPGRDVEVDHMLGANMSVRRDVVAELGGIHDYYPGTCLREESDIALRIRRAGYRIIYTPAAAVDHLAGPYARGRRFDTRYKYYGNRNHVVLLTRTLGWSDPHVRRFLGSALLEIAGDVRAGLKSVRDPSRTSVRAKARGVAGAALRAAAKSAGLAAGIAVSIGLSVRLGPLSTGRGRG